MRRQHPVHAILFADGDYDASRPRQCATLRAASPRISAADRFIAEIGRQSTIWSNSGRNPGSRASRVRISPVTGERDDSALLQKNYPPLCIDVDFDVQPERRS
jgi:hypothetical protein